MSKILENTVYQSLDEGYQAVALEVGKNLEQAQARISELETELAAKEGTIADNKAAIDRAAAEAARQLGELERELKEAKTQTFEYAKAVIANALMLHVEAEIRKLTEPLATRAEAAEAALAAEKRRMVELEDALGGETARANLWERNYTQSETKTMKALRLRAEAAESDLKLLHQELDRLQRATGPQTCDAHASFSAGCLNCRLAQRDAQLAAAEERERGLREANERLLQDVETFEEANHRLGAALEAHRRFHSKAGCPGAPDCLVCCAEAVYSSRKSREAEATEECAATLDRSMAELCARLREHYEASGHPICPDPECGELGDEHSSECAYVEYVKAQDGATTNHLHQWAAALQPVPKGETE